MGSFWLRGEHPTTNANPQRDRTGHKSLEPQFPASSRRLQTEGKSRVLEDRCQDRSWLLTPPSALHKAGPSPSAPGTQGASSGHAAPHGHSAPTDTSKEGRGPGHKHTGSCLCFEKYTHSLTGKRSFTTQNVKTVELQVIFTYLPFSEKFWKLEVLTIRKKKSRMLFPS